MAAWAKTASRWKRAMLVNALRKARFRSSDIERSLGDHDIQLRRESEELSFPSSFSKIISIKLIGRRGMKNVRYIVLFYIMP